MQQQAWGPSTGQWGSGSSGLERGDEWAAGLLASKPSIAAGFCPLQQLPTLEKASKNAADPAEKMQSDSIRSAHMFASPTEFDSLTAEQPQR